jgi:hypothetical protein
MKLRLNKFPSIHPYLFAIIPILFLYSRNINQLPLHIIFLPMAITLILTLISLFILRETKVNYNKAAVFVTFYWVWFFLYTSVRDFIIEYNFYNFVSFEIYRHRFLIPIWVLVLALFLIVVIRHKSSFENAKDFLNVTGIVLIMLQIVTGIINYSSYNLNVRERKESLDNIVDKTIFDRIVTKPMLNKIVTNKVMLPKESLPPIYYIVIDAYAGAAELNEVLDFDNSGFINYLEGKGFYVAKYSHSNYSDTSLSMSATLNMQYLPIVDLPKNGSGTITLKSGIPYYQLMNNNHVVKFLESIGYTYINFATYGKQGFYYRNALVNSFNLELLKQSILCKPVVDNNLAEILKREEILRQFEELGNVSNLQGPTFVYAHILIPHPPYVFDRDGNEPSLVPSALQTGSEEKLYLDQLIFASKMTQKIIDKILAHSQKEPIIIVQGDHGPRNTERNEEESRRLQMSILNAYHFPVGGSLLLYDFITPVNSFRIMLNYYFGQHLPMLEDESFFSSRPDSKTLIRMTNQLREKNPEPKSKQPVRKIIW